MSPTLLIICHSQHQLEKGLFLKKMLPNKVDIKCINFIPAKIKSKKNFSVVKSSQELIDCTNYYDRFIFFSIVPSKVSFEIVKAIRKSQKIIIVIQETHQLSMSHGSINSIMMSPDLIIAASDAERDFMIQNNLFKKNTINSSGWIFQKKFHEFVHQELMQNEDNNFNNYVLIIFSAPRMITASSKETYQKRKEILDWIQKNNPNKEILIKLHPLENRQKFINHLDMKNKSLVNFAPSHSNVYSLSLNAQKIFLSDQTQAFIDLANTNKELIVYKLKDENFITSFLSETIRPNHYKGIDFFEIADSGKALEVFRSVYLKPESECLASLAGSINDPNIQINSITNIEIGLWEYVLGNSKTPNPNELGNAEKIINFIEDNRSFDFNDIENEIKTTSIQASVTIYIINKIINGEIDNLSQIKYFLKNFITPNFVQYFFLEILRFKFFLNYLKLEMNISKDSLEIINNSMEMIQKKSFLINLLFIFEAKIYGSKMQLVRAATYMLINLCMKAIIRFKK
jgi:hypothetical protein